MKRLLYFLRSLQFIGISALTLSLCPSLVSAATVSPCETGTLASYIDEPSTWSCTVGTIALSGFSNFSVTSVGNPTVATSSEITVTPITNLDGNAGFALSAMQGGTNFFSISAGSVTYSLNYFLDPFVGEIGLDPPSGDVTATQQYCVGDVFNDGCSHGTLLSQAVTTASPNSTIILGASPSFVDVNTTITLNGPASFDALNIVYGMGSPAPEPASLLLMGVGFAILIGFPVMRGLRTH